MGEGPPRPPVSSESTSLQDSDFIFATGTCLKRRRLARASRGWRGPQLRAFFLTDSEAALPGLNEDGAAAAESYAFFPSEGSEELGGWFRGLRAGDTRAAAAPFAAHRHYGDTYKWMLYGDDDTVFFMDAVRELLSRFDPDQPVALSDNLWSDDRHPNPHAPRCLPCRMANQSLPTLEHILTSALGRADIRFTFEHHYGRHRISEDEYKSFARNATQLPGLRYMPRAACPRCTRRAACAQVDASGSGGAAMPCTASVAHGGTGMILSVGLLRAISYRTILQCFLDLANSTGGDHMVSECLWRHDVAFTDPGASVRHMYDPHYVMFGGNAGFIPLLDPSGGAMRAGRCDARCRWMLRHVVTSHVNARTAKDWEALARHLEELPRMRLAACDKLLGGSCALGGAVPGEVVDVAAARRQEVLVT